MNFLKVVFTSSLLILLIICCKKNKQIPVPIISTQNVEGLTISTLKSGGEVTDDMGIPVTEVGIVWGTSDAPSLENHTGKAKSNNLNASFSCSMSNLQTNTTYYVRAYALNTAGIGYGKAICFVSDAEGNVYRTVSIGKQTWMTENLRTVLFNDGSAITKIEDSDQWNATSLPAYCWYDNNISNKFVYGGLYNFYAVSTNKLAPEGWHVASKYDWDLLAKNLGGELVAGGKLKEQGIKENNTGKWLSPNTGGTNESGFTAIPGGVRNGSIFFNINKFGFYWTSSEYQNGQAWRYELGYNSSSLFSTTSASTLGFSVRCIKN